MTNNSIVTCSTKEDLASKKERRGVYTKAWIKILKVRTKWGTKNLKYSVVKGDCAFCSAYNDRLIKIDSWVYEAVNNISRGTLARKRGIISKESARGLVPKAYSGRPLLLDSDYPEIKQFMDTQMQANPYMCCGKLISLVQEQFSEESMPSSATLRRYYDRSLLGL